MPALPKDMSNGQTAGKMAIIGPQLPCDKYPAHDSQPLFLVGFSAAGACSDKSITRAFGELEGGIGSF